MAGTTIINPVALEDNSIVTGAQANMDIYDGPLRRHVPEDARFCVILLRSVDGGKTRSHESVIRARSGGYGETSLCAVNGRLWLAHVRTPQGNVVQYESRDKGRTWTGPTNVTQAGGSGSAGQHPGWVLRLASGKLLATWGNRRAPYGAGAMLSHDDGRTWDYEHRVALAWDAPGGNCGYANAAQTGDGNIIVTYYTMPTTSNYHDLWSKAEIHTVRFTEQQFVAASRSKGKQSDVTSP